MMTLIGIDLAVPKDTDLNRKPKQQVASTKSDPPRVKHPRRRRSCMASMTNRVSPRSLHAESKNETVLYSLGGEANIEDMAPYVPEEHVLAVGRLLPNDFAFVRRSGGKFCIAMVKSVQPDPEEGIVMDLYVNEAGATKSIPMSEWDSYIRPVKPYVTCVGRVRVSRKNNKSSSLQDNGNRRASCPESELDYCMINASVQHVKANKNGFKQARDEHKEGPRGSSANPTRSLRDSKSTKSNNPDEDDAVRERNVSSASPSLVNRVNFSEDIQSSLDPGIGANAHYATASYSEEPVRPSSENTSDTLNPSLKLNEDPNNGTTLKSSLRSSVVSSLRESCTSVNEAIPAIKEHHNSNDDLSRHVQWNIQSSSCDNSKSINAEATGDAYDDEHTDSSNSFHHQYTSSRRPFMRRCETEDAADRRSHLYKQELERSQSKANTKRTKPTADMDKSLLAKQTYSRRASTTDIDNSAPAKQTHSRRASAADAGNISKQPQRRGSLRSSMRSSMRGSLISQNGSGRGLSDSQVFNESQLLSAFASIRTEKKCLD
eukprot:scaffold25652_cov67-Cyclotella_meneghiniana.AAC.2